MTGLGDDVRILQDKLSVLDELTISMLQVIICKSGVEAITIDLIHFARCKLKNLFNFIKYTFGSFKLLKTKV